MPASASAKRPTTGDDLRLGMRSPTVVRRLRLAQTREYPNCELRGNVCARVPGCSAARTRASADRPSAGPPPPRRARAAPRGAPRGGCRGRRCMANSSGSAGLTGQGWSQQRTSSKPAAPQPLLGLLRGGVVPGAHEVRHVLGVGRLGGDLVGQAAEGSMLPLPPHWATSGAPGRSAACSRSNRASWSLIQWKTAFEKAASTGSSSSSSVRLTGSSTLTRGSPAKRSRACSIIDGRRVGRHHARRPAADRAGARSRGRCRSPRRARSRGPRAATGRAPGGPSPPAASETRS